MNDCCRRMKGQEEFSIPRPNEDQGTPRELRLEGKKNKKMQTQLGPTETRKELNRDNRSKITLWVLLFVEIMSRRYLFIAFCQFLSAAHQNLLANTILKATIKHLNC